MQSADNILRGILEPPASDAIGLPTFTITPYGVLAHAPIIEAFDLTVLVLFCTQEKQHLGLLLHRCPDAHDPSRPLYHVCFRFSSGVPVKIGRMIDLGEDVTKPQLKRSAVTAEWKSIYLAHRAPAAAPTRMLLNRGKAAPFRIPLWHIKELELNAFVDLLTPANRMLPFPWNGAPPAILRFHLKQSIASGETRRDFAVCLGRCVASTSERERDRVRSLGPHWANVQPLQRSGRDAPIATPTHDCTTHHIADWPRQAKTFSTFSMRDGELGAVLLSFAPCAMNPAGTYVVNIKPLGWPVSAPKSMAFSRLPRVRTYIFSGLNRVIGPLESKAFTVISAMRSHHIYTIAVGFGRVFPWNLGPDFPRKSRSIDVLALHRDVGMLFLPKICVQMFVITMQTQVQTPTGSLLFLSTTWPAESHVASPGPRGERTGQQLSHIPNRPRRILREKPSAQPTNGVRLGRTSRASCMHGKAESDVRERRA